MKKLFLYMLLLAFSAVALSLKAQEVDPVQLKQEADRLKGVIKAKQAKSDSLDLELKKFPDIKMQIESLDKEYKRKAGIVIQLQGESYELIKTFDSIKLVLDEVGPEFDTLVARNLKLEKHKQTVAPLVKRQLNQMANDIDKTWLDKTYADTDKSKLLEELKLYEDFKDEDHGVGKAYLKLKAFSDDLVLYRQGMEAVNNPYEAKNVAALVQPLSALAKRETHPGRQLEAETLYGQLKDYKNTVRYFQEDIIPEVDKILSNNKGNKREAWNQVKNYLDTGDGGMIRHYLTKIPWIGEQYGLYIKQLENDPFGKNAARKTIMGIKP